jgi:hypothetical protein
LPFRLVESLVNIRAAHPDRQRSALPGHIADACMRVLGVPAAEIPGLQAATDRCLAVPIG